jgi:hypothetical protein
MNEGATALSYEALEAVQSLPTELESTLRIAQILSSDHGEYLHERILIFWLQESVMSHCA